MDWRDRAACRDEDPELHFPVGTSGPALLQIAEAKTVCRRCPVVSRCLSYALETNQPFGVWGGMSEREREALKRRNARTRARSAPVVAREPLAIDGHIVAAPLAHGTGALWRNAQRTRHAVDADGRAMCDDVLLDVAQAQPVASVAAGDLCGRPGCRKAFARSRVAPGVTAIAGESVLHDRSTRWHPVGEDGLPACGTLVLAVARKPAVEVEQGRRCRQAKCRRVWARLDELAVPHG